MTQDIEFIPYGWPEPSQRYLQATRFFDYDHPAVRSFVEDAVAGHNTPKEQVVALFYAIRDSIRYDPFSATLTPECYYASTVVTQGAAFCIPKASLLVAGARMLGIPAGIGLSDVVNHFTSPKMQQWMGSREVFMHHGWAAMLIEDQWVKAVPAFNKELCEMMKVPPTEFDGTEDAILQQYSEDGSVQMEYLKDHGMWSDLPFQRIDADWSAYYPASMWNHQRAEA